MTAPTRAANAAPRGPTMVPDGEFAMTERDFAAIAAILETEAGIMLPPGKATMAYSRLAKRLRTLHLSNFAEYLALVDSPTGKDERQNLIQSLTTNVTNFFREPHHFDHLKKNILPNLITRAKHGDKIRLWSAGCSSGQEPYSIALTLISLMPDAAQYDIKILATDIDNQILSVGANGVYDGDMLAPVPSDLRSRYFSPNREHPGTFRANESLRSLISFRQLNLIGKWPMRGKYQVIFCRNVVIYFSAATQEQYWSRLIPLMEPGAALYIGHSERVSGPVEKILYSDGVTTYRNPGATK